MQDELLRHYSAPLPKCEALEPAHRFNNYVKAWLICTFMKPGAQVLDLACGRGGDLKKLRQNGAGSYYGVDLVPERIEEAKARHHNTHCMFGAVFEVADFAQPLQLLSTYDFVSCQFALHYACDSRERALIVMSNAAQCLAEGGYIVLTFPDAGEVLRRVGQSLCWAAKHQSIRFECAPTEGFGCKYIYYHEGTVDHLPEYLVPVDLLRDVWAELGLEVVLDRKFEDFYCDHDPRLAHRMGVRLPLDAECDAVARLYRAVVLQKVERSAKRRRG